MTATTCEAHDLPNDEYHKMPCISSSKLEKFRQSRRVYEALYVTHTLAPKPPTDAMELGTLVHLLVLERDKFNECVAVRPATAPDGSAWNLRKPTHREWRNEWERSCEGKLTPDGDTLATALAMAEAVHSHPKAKKLLAQAGDAERSIFWTDAESDLRCMCRVDYFAPISIDLKSARDVSPGIYANDLVRLGYLRKRAHYLAGLKEVGIEKFVHIAVQNTWPYTVACYELDDYDRDGNSLGAVQRRRLLYDLRECHESGDWREPWEKSIWLLEAPAWAHREQLYSVGADHDG